MNILTVSIESSDAIQVPPTLKRYEDVFMMYHLEDLDWSAVMLLLHRPTPSNLSRRQT